MRTRVKKWIVLAGVLAIMLTVVTSQVFAQNQDEEFQKLYQELRTNFFKGKYSEALANIEALMANLEELKALIEKEISSQPSSTEKETPYLIAKSALPKPGYPNRVVDSIPVGQHVEKIAITPDGKYLYASVGSSVVVIRTSDKTVVDKISIGEHHEGIAVTPNGHYVYLTNHYLSTVSVIRTSDNSVVDTIPVGEWPKGIAITPDGKYAYVANYRSSTVSVIRTSDNTVVDEISLPRMKDIYGAGVDSMPSQIAIAPNGKHIYVTNWSSGKVLLIQTSDHTRHRLADNIPVGLNLYPITITPDGAYVYAVSFTKGGSVIRTSDNSVVHKFSDGSRIAITPDGKYLYSGGRSEILVMRTSDNTVVDEISVEDWPTEVVFAPDGKYAYLGQRRGYDIVIIGFK